MADNPNAFPVSTIDGFTEHGMTLRDWFAGQALNAMLGSPHATGRITEEHFARTSFEMADAMLAAREQVA